MPDLFAHFAAAQLLSQGRRSLRAPFILGALAPDVAARIPSVVLGDFFGFNVDWALLIFHAPVGFLLVGWLFSLLFAEGERWGIFVALVAGQLLHLLLDLMQTPLHVGVYHVFFPFAFGGVHWDFFSSEASVDFFPLFLLVSLILFYRDWPRAGRKDAS